MRLYREFLIVALALLVVGRGFAQQRELTYEDLFWSKGQPLSENLKAQRLVAQKNLRVRSLQIELQAVRQKLSRLLFQSPDAAENNERQLAELTSEKESLEVKLAQLMPQAENVDDALKLLNSCLPVGAVFVDCFKYTPFLDQQPSGYVVFVQAKGSEPVRVGLGDVEPIDGAIQQWRQAITAGKDASVPAHLLQQLVWKPIRDHFPKGTNTVFLSPDGALHQLAIAALPDGADGRIVLENYTTAYVESGATLQTQLSMPRKPPARTITLAVGDVRYDPPGENLGRPYATRPSAANEVACLRKIAGHKVIALTGGDATTDAVLAQIQKVTHAHIATHGMFWGNEYKQAAEQLKEARQRRLNESNPGESVTGVLALGGRNPLAYVGMVLAGANKPSTKTDDGILSGEEMLWLNLDRLELVVLSGGDTGSGVNTMATGVMSLAFALHASGCRNVIASRWQIDDEATAALMATFYHELWIKKKPLLTAWRLAQLAIYQHPELILKLARGVGPEYEEALAMASKPARGKQRTHPQRWAAFFLSGPGL